MGWVDDLHERTVLIDTAPLIAYIAKETPYLELVRPLFQAIAKGDLHAVTSMITVAEVLVHPLREDDTELAAQYQDILLHSGNLATLPVSEEIALKTAEVRATHNLRMPDAIQVATALVSGASVFITNDKRLRVPSPLKRIVLDELLNSLHPPRRKHAADEPVARPEPLGEILGHALVDPYGQARRNDFLGELVEGLVLNRVPHAGTHLLGGDGHQVVPVVHAATAGRPAGGVVVGGLGEELEGHPGWDRAAEVPGAGVIFLGYRAHADDRLADGVLVQVGVDAIVLRVVLPELDLVGNRPGRDKQRRRRRQDR